MVEILKLLDLFNNLSLRLGCCFLLLAALIVFGDAQESGAAYVALHSVAG